ncbi:MAG: hypothetical protein PHI48_05575 [Bacteroidales bacterium]|nr:hypothetical protein [Bacteroidales bacterium]
MIHKCSLTRFVLCCCMAVTTMQAKRVSAAVDPVIQGGRWTIAYDRDAKTVDFIHDGQPILKGVFVKAKSGNVVLQSTEYETITFSKEKISDAFGKGEKHTISYSGLKGQPEIRQLFYLYPKRDYFLTEAYLVAATGTSSNYIAPVVTTTPSAFLEADTANRVLSVPFDNDDWVRYSSLPLRTDSVSFEVTSIFSGKQRKGLVIGSVEHDTWKTGIRYATSDNRTINRLECFGGITHALTRDLNKAGSDRPSKEHGSIAGTTLKSPKVLVGMFDDWRKGIECYGEANALVAPKRKGTKMNIFGWNSWGAMAEKLNYLGAMDVSDYIHTHLQPAGFNNEGTTYVILDSYWDRLNEEQLRAFVQQCNANGQVPGIYWSPFSDWGGRGNATMEGSSYTYNDAYLYANGEKRKIASLALDPTHPGTQKRMDFFIGRFKRLGFKYIKLDFLNNGILEADAYYDKKVTTGVQAYNKGMEYLAALCGDELFMALSIAPVFPSQYGNSRRISCDAWGALKDTEYELNSLSFGWWLDRVYPFNDGDHIVLSGNSESENRMRVTSGVITGTYILGDNFSQKGSCIGDLKAREKAEKFVTNPDINAIGRIGKSFAPVEGYTAAGTNRAEELLLLRTDDALFVAAFNLTDKEKPVTIEWSRLGLSSTGKKQVKELWSGETTAVKGASIKTTVPAKDVKLFRISL